MAAMRAACLSMLAFEVIGEGQLRGSGQRAQAAAGCKFSSNGTEFDQLTLGSKIVALASKGFAFAHEAPMYLQKHDRVVFVSNRLSCDKLGGFGPEACWRLPGKGVDQFAVISSIDLKTSEVTELDSSVWFDKLVMANGGYPAADGKGEHVFMSSQGLGLANQKAAGIYRLNVVTQEVEPVITKTSHPGEFFNSPNDLVVDPVSKALLFTDPSYGYEQGFRPYPTTGNWLWMYTMPASGEKDELPLNLKVLGGAESFARPNGVAFASERGDVLYVTDTGYFPGAVFAFDVRRDSENKIEALDNRRFLFAAQDGIPDGIKVDCEGRIYTGENNGVAIYSKEGDRLGVVRVPEGVANFVLVPRESSTQLVMMGELHVYSTMISTKTCVIAR